MNVVPLNSTSPSSADKSRSGKDGNFPTSGKPDHSAHEEFMRAQWRRVFAEIYDNNVPLIAQVTGRDESTVRYWLKNGGGPTLSAVARVIHDQPSAAEVLFGVAAE